MAAANLSLAETLTVLAEVSTALTEAKIVLAEANFASAEASFALAEMGICHNHPALPSELPDLAVFHPFI